MAMAALPENTPEARVLVVDDEANIVELLSVSLKFQGFEVHTASSGPAALDKAREVRPDAVILDVMMPGMDGFGLLRRLRADGIDSPHCSSPPETPSRTRSPASPSAATTTSPNRSAWKRWSLD